MAHSIDYEQDVLHVPLDDHTFTVEGEELMPHHIAWSEVIRLAKYPQPRLRN